MEGLMEALARVVNAKTAGHPGLTWRPADVADALLAGPLAAVLRQAEADRAAVERVREVADGLLMRDRVIALRILRVLDGDS